MAAKKAAAKSATESISSGAVFEATPDAVPPKKRRQPKKKAEKKQQPETQKVPAKVSNSENLSEGVNIIQQLDAAVSKNIQEPPVTETAVIKNTTYEINAALDIAMVDSTAVEAIEDNSVQMNVDAPVVNDSDNNQNAVSEESSAVNTADANVDVENSVVPIVAAHDEDMFDNENTNDGSNDVDQEMPVETVADAQVASEQQKEATKEPVATAPVNETPTVAGTLTKDPFKPQQQIEKPKKKKKKAGNEKISFKN